MAKQTRACWHRDDGAIDKSPRRCAARSSAQLPRLLGEFLLPTDVEAAEVDGVEQQGREAAFAGDVGDEAAQEREQDRRAVDEQERLKRLFGHIDELEQAAVDAFHDVDRAVLVGRVGLEVDGAR